MKPVIARFSNLYTLDNGCGCWVWRGHKDSKGYGNFWFKGAVRKAHRVSFTIFKGEITTGLQVCHTCDNTSCVNPDHLFLGSSLENNQDKVSKGRQARGETNRHKLTEKEVLEVRDLYPRFSARALGRIYKVSGSAIASAVSGESWRHLEPSGAKPLSKSGVCHHGAKLSEESVYEIRRRYFVGGVAQVQLAEAFDVSVHTVRAVISRRLWKHLPELTEEDLAMIERVKGNWPQGEDK